MANRRMFSLDVVDTDRFLDMGSGAQLLYYNLGMHADDDGFVTSPKKIQRNCRATDGDFRELMREGYIKVFDSGVIVITHWKQNNFIRSDRYKPTRCVEEKAQIASLQNGTYALLSESPQLEVAATVDDAEPDSNQNATKRDTVGIPDGIPDGSQSVPTRETQVRLGKDRLGQERLELGEDSPGEKKKRTAKPFSPPSFEQCQAYYQEKRFTFDLDFFYRYFTELKWHDGNGKPVKNWKAKMLTWQHREEERGSKQQARQGSFMQHTEEERGGWADAWGVDDE